jgi:hypothetical protein
MLGRRVPGAVDERIAIPAIARINPLSEVIVAGSDIRRENTLFGLSRGIAAVNYEIGYCRVLRRVAVETTPSP